MAKHPTSSRVRREGSAPDDAFVATVKRTADWAQNNRTVLVVGLAVVAVLVLGGLWFSAQERQTEAAAAAQFTQQVQPAVASGNVQLAIRDLQSFLSRFGGTETADQARLILADLLIGQEQAEEALSVLEEADAGLDEPLGLAIARMRAAGYEALGNVDAAVETYLTVAREARFAFQQQEALGDAARIRLQNGDPQAAASLYEDIVEGLEEGDPERAYYRMWLAEARSQAETGAGTQPAAPAEETAQTPEPDNG